MADIDYTATYVSKWMNPATWPSLAEQHQAPLAVSTDAALLRSCMEFAKECMAGRDASHDYDHVLRVTKIAVSLAHALDVQAGDLQDIIVLTALLHDVHDHKYTDCKDMSVEDWLTSQGTSEAVANGVSAVLSRHGWSNQLPGGTAASEKLPGDLQLALDILHDADTIDAVGALGVARAVTFGGFKKRPLMDATNPPVEHFASVEEYKARCKVGTTVDHFYEKLFKLAGSARTEPARKVMAARHKRMVRWLDEYLQEWACDDIAEALRPSE